MEGKTAVIFSREGVFPLAFPKRFFCMFTISDLVVHGVIALKERLSSPSLSFPILHRASHFSGRWKPGQLW